MCFKIFWLLFTQKSHVINVAKGWVAHWAIFGGRWATFRKQTSGHTARV
jgi:hypothetical protein